MNNDVRCFKTSSASACFFFPITGVAVLWIGRSARFHPEGDTMSTIATLATAAGTTGLQGWIKSNIIPLLLLLVATMLFVLAQRGDNAKAMRVVAGVVIALAVLGLATSGKADSVGSWMASLITG